MDSVDVLVVGAGPTGLMMAIECARYGLTCRIIDQAASPMAYSKAIAIQARTLETFQRIGIHERFIKSGIKLRASNIYSSHKKRARVNLELIDSPFSFVLSIEQNKTEHILTDYLHELGVTVERSTRLISYEERDGCIFAHTDKETLRANYLIGCDGAHSTVRKAMGGTFKGKTFHDIFSLADVKIDWDRPHHELHVFLESEGIVAAFPLPEEGRYRLIFQLKRLRGLFQHHLAIEHGIVTSDVIAVPTLGEIQELLTSCSQEPAEVSDPRWIANFHINSRLSNRYRKNTLFLAGDAAHIHSPVGGQGMNTGIQDAFNLAWKIAYVHKRGSSVSRLDSYEHERHGLGKKLLKGTERASRIVSLRSSLLVFARNHLLSFLLSSQRIQKRLVSALAEINIQSPKERVPNYTILHEGKEIDFFVITEKSTDFHLLLFNVAEAPLNHPHVKVYHVKGNSPPKALLVRPDGYLALEDHPPFNKILSYQI